MGFLKTLGYILVTIILLWVIVAFFSPKELGTSQSIVINKSSYVIFEQVENLKFWSNWSPWQKKDPDMKQEYSENYIGKGATVIWESETAGNGKQTIVNSIYSESIKTEMKFEGWDGKTIGNWRFEENDKNTTTVTWDLEGSELPFIIRPMGFIWGKGLEEDYKTGLNNLKEYCENISKENEALHVSVVKTKAINYIGKKIVTTNTEIASEMGAAYYEMINFLKENDIEMTGNPFSINISYDTDSIEFIAGIEIDGTIDNAEGFETGTIESGTAAMISHFGNYTNLPASYKIIMNWIEKEKYKTNGNSYEVYLTDPESEKDTAKWETRIYFPIK